MRQPKNVEAYNLYLQAEALVKADFLGSDAKYNELLEKAVELDPEFIHAWSNLSTHHMAYYSNGLDKTDGRLARARKALRSAEQLDPHHAMTRLARGTYYYYGFQRLRSGSRRVSGRDKARAAATHYARLQVGNIYRRLGRWAECVENQQAAMELDPQNGNIARQLATTYEGLREFEQARYCLERAAAVEPHVYTNVFELAVFLVRSSGDMEAARKILDTKPEENSFFYHLGQYLMNVWSGEYTQAEEAARAIDNSTPLFNAYPATPDINC